MTPPHPSIAALAGADWDDTGSVLAACTPVFDALTTEPGTLDSLLTALQNDTRLQDMCERYDFLDKLVLHDTPGTGIRIRLHLYRAGYFDRPHNHRWSFAARILHGQYTHRFFGDDREFSPDTDPDTLRPLCERTETPGATYALHHTSVHTVQAAADTVSLLIRGPAAKEKFLILDRSTGGSFWAYGAASETPAQKARKRMTRAELAETISRARALTRQPETSGGTR